MVGAGKFLEIFKCHVTCKGYDRRLFRHVSWSHITVDVILLLYSYPLLRSKHKFNVFYLM